VRVLADPFGHVLLLQVEDNGPGIAETDRELVFEPFYRVLGNEADGSGLGCRSCGRLRTSTARR
jgi:two-component system sensor histidine kinase TctE